MSFPTSHEDESSSSSSLLHMCRQLKFSEIQLATENFSESLVIGHGGFGKVYKGSIRNGANLLTVAIKRLDSTSNQGAIEFWAEIKILSKLRHCHLVSLVGYCNDRQEMILVYEYMSRGSLEDHLHKRQTTLPWVRRLKICIGAARGLDYLHTGTNIKHGVIHRDVKSSNILLHNSGAAKISDFGLSRLCPRNQQSTYVNTIVKGTFGYLDPNYFYTGKLTGKSDVYAFGVVLFEVLCGKRAVDTSLDEEQCSLAIWAQDSIKEGRLKKIVDSNIREEISLKCLKMFAHLAKRCLHNHPKQRPTMAEIVVGLEFVLALALQENANKTLYHAGMTIFGKRVPKFVSEFNVENSVESGSDKSRMPYQFDYDTIAFATDYFSDANKIPEYAFDCMYKGVLENEQEIAIARDYPCFKHEIIDKLLLLDQLQHDNLPKLLGYCVKETTPLYVFKLAACGSLDHLISDQKCTYLGWDERYKIILSVARVILYLHKNTPIRIIHGDIRPQNILLDKSLEPKLYNFRFAKCLMNETDCIYVNRIPTWEYTSPEYQNYGRLSTKSDVFSFGMLILKVISGCRKYKDIPNALENFVQYAWTNWWAGKYSSIVDPRIDADSSSIRRFIHIGLLCVQTNASDRPTMEDVNGMLLSSSFLDLPIPVSPSLPQTLEGDLYCDAVTAEEFISELPVPENLSSPRTSEEDLDCDNCDAGTAEEFIWELESR